MENTDRTEIGISKIHSNGRVQVPKEVRTKMDLNDGNKVIWYINRLGDVCIRKTITREAPKGIRYPEPER
jgi:AbrB family looped-hinge helix DNA binding protein